MVFSTDSFLYACARSVRERWQNHIRLPLKNPRNSCEVPLYYYCFFVLISSVITQGIASRRSVYASREGWAELTARQTRETTWPRERSGEALNLRVNSKVVSFQFFRTRLRRHTATKSFHNSGMCTQRRKIFGSLHRISRVWCITARLE